MPGTESRTNLQKEPRLRRGHRSPSQERGATQRATSRRRSRLGPRGLHARLCRVAVCSQRLGWHHLALSCMSLRPRGCRDPCVASWLPGNTQSSQGQKVRDRGTRREPQRYRETTGSRFSHRPCSVRHEVTLAPGGQPLRFTSLFAAWWLRGMELPGGTSVTSTVDKSHEGWFSED